MGKFILIIIGIIFLCGLAYVIFSVAVTCGGPDTNPHDMPDADKATHSFSWSSGGLAFSSDYETHGSEVGKRIFILHGYWELRGQKFKYLDGDIVLDENIFGKITVKRR